MKQIIKPCKKNTNSPEQQTGNLWVWILSKSFVCLTRTLKSDESSNRTQLNVVQIPRRFQTISSNAETTMKFEVNRDKMITWRFTYMNTCTHFGTKQTQSNSIRYKKWHIHKDSNKGTNERRSCADPVTSLDTSSWRETYYQSPRIKPKRRQRYDTIRVIILNERLYRAAPFWFVFFLGLPNHKPRELSCGPTN